MSSLDPKELYGQKKAISECIEVIDVQAAMKCKSFRICPGFSVALCCQRKAGINIDTELKTLWLISQISEESRSNLFWPK